MGVYLKGKNITKIKNYLDKDVLIPYMKIEKKNRNLFSLYEQGKIDDSSLNKDILIKLITDQMIDLGTTINRQLAYSLEFCIDGLSGIISKWCGDGFKETEDNLYEIIIDIFTKLLSTK